MHWGERGSARLALGLALLLFAGACAANQARPRSREALANFIRPPAGSSLEDRQAFDAGRALFAKRWTEAEGLGPLFDGQSCLICHPRGGNGRPVSPDRTEAENASMIVRLAGGSLGHQLQRRAVSGPGEDELSISYSETAFAFPDGETVYLRKPAYRFRAAAPGGYSVIVAPKIAGTGLIDAIPEEAIRASADPEDADGDGISGRSGPGRFGWRADAGTVAEQTARALALDMGLASTLYPVPSGDCPGAPCDGPGIEVGEQPFAQLVAFVRMVAPPPRGTPRPEGEALFRAIGCAACHRPSWNTGPAPEPWLSEQTIWPYSDLLLHDMGAGLADGLGSEWRTAPLWGLTLRRQVHGEEFYLHDGRARSVTEAILWHGGEATRARAAFAALPPGQRRTLLAFLATL